MTRPTRPPLPATHWQLVIDGWTPPSVNGLLRRHWAARGRVKREVEVEISIARLRAAAAAVAPIPDATGKRWVSIAVTVAGRSGMPDPDNVLKALLDALRANRLIVDDSARWCEIGAIQVSRGDARRTIIILEDV